MENQNPSVLFPEENEDLKRLMEVSSDVKKMIEEKNKEIKKKRLLWLSILVLLTALISLEALLEYPISKKIHSIFRISKESPHNGNLVPMHFSGKTPLLIPQNEIHKNLNITTPENQIGDSDDI